jgi:hypothetical protein
MAAINAVDWLGLAKQTFTSSTDYFDANIRPQVESDMRQFEGKHPSGSKYFSDAYKGKSRLFRPKTRATIRKNSAVAATAYFSTNDVVHLEAENESDPMQLASADINKALLNYRLTKTIPWFQICMGAYQDAQVTGVVCSYQYWKFDQEKGVDEPCIELIPIENVRVAPSSNWLDPINSSPYVHRLIPMYVRDIKRRMKADDYKTGQPKWKQADEGVIRTATKHQWDSIRQQREGQRTDSKDNDGSVTDFEVAWVHEVFMEIDGQDYVYYTLGVEHILTTPVPLHEVYFHNVRPLVMGSIEIEAHKLYSSSLPNMTADIQKEANELANTRLDNLKLALNKRYFAKRNRQVDLRSLTRNVSGSVTLMTDPEKDVKVQETKDVTGSSYQEQDRLNLDFDDLAGVFSGSSVQSNRSMNETVGGLNLISETSNVVSEYQLRIFNETWAEKVLRQLIMLQQAYETDTTLLALVGNKAELFQKYGVNEINDELIEQDLVLKVQVGVGAVNPQRRLERFTMAMGSIRDLMGEGVMQQANGTEIINEVFGNAGYKDGSRFFDLDGPDPQVQELQAIIEQLQQELDNKKPDPEEQAAKIDKIKAETKSIMANTQQTGVETKYSAIQAAENVVAVPEVAPVADELMREADGDLPDDLGDLPESVEAGLISDLHNQGLGAAEPTVPENTSPAFPPVPQQPSSGQSGIETQGFE